MILVDTSAWLEFEHATGSIADVRLTELVASDATVATTEPVYMEVLAGARSDLAEAKLRQRLSIFALLPFDPVVDFDAAVHIYRSCRRRGITPRDMIDCMIASVALRYRAAVLAQDIDFSRIATVVPLELDPATPRDP